MTSTSPGKPKLPAPLAIPVQYQNRPNPERPTLAKKSSTIHLGAYRPVLKPTSNANERKPAHEFFVPDGGNTTGEETDNTRRAIRIEMLRWVANEMESIEQETNATVAARRNQHQHSHSADFATTFSTRLAPQTQTLGRKRGYSALEPSSPIAAAILDPPNLPPPLLPKRRPQARRGSIDSVLPENFVRPGFATPAATAEPRKAKDWERWAEDKVKTRRRLEEVWKKEDDDFAETQRLIRETEAREKAQREKDARKDWERRAFLERERQRSQRERVELDRDRQRNIKDEKERNTNRQREREEAMLAEEQRRREIEEQRRVIEEETRRMQEELNARQKEREESKPAPETRGRQQHQQSGRGHQYFTPSHSRSRTPAFEEPYSPTFDEDSDILEAEWSRFAEFFKIGSNPSRAHSRSNSTRFNYQTPASTFRDAWESYENRWSKLCAPHPGGNSTTSTPPRLGFSDIPWPVLNQPRRASDIGTQLTEGNIASFILSSFHSSATPQGSVSSSPNSNNDARARKLRLREALLRWHPDKMARIIAQTAEDQRAAVKEGAETVARHLNALLARES